MTSLNLNRPPARHTFFGKLGLVLYICILGLAACSPARARISPVTPSLAPTTTWTAISASPTPLPPTSTDTPTPPPLPTSTPTPTPVPPLRFAVIGDFGEGNQAEADVANLVASWNPDFVITTGDNNYPSGAYDTIDDHIGQYYHNWIAPYQGKYGAGATENRFFPVLGNHDWLTDQAQPYLNYFSLPGNERYYDFIEGPVHFFALDSDSHEPDGVSSNSVQAVWLKDQLANSTSTWNLVYFHHPPYSSGLHGPITWMRWPFQAWGADAVLSGHDHTYERLSLDGENYFVNGLGGGPRYDFEEISKGSQMRFNADYGAMLVTADQAQINFQFFTRSGEAVDSFTLSKDNAP